MVPHNDKPKRQSCEDTHQAWCCGRVVATDECRGAQRALYRDGNSSSGVWELPGGPGVTRSVWKKRLHQIFEFRGDDRGLGIVRRGGEKFLPPCDQGFATERYRPERWVTVPHILRDRRGCRLGTPAALVGWSLVVSNRHHRWLGIPTTRSRSPATQWAKHGSSIVHRTQHVVVE